MSKIDFRKGFLFSAPDLANIVGVPLVRSGIVGVEFERLLELSLSARKIPVVLHLVAAQNGMRMSQGRVQLQGLAGGAVRLRKVFVWIAAKVRQYGIGIGQTRIGRA